MTIKRHTVYNLAGSITPMLVSMLTVPAYLHLIGSARYGVLALTWLFLGYFGLFDPGITRAATFHIARLHARTEDRERESVFWTALGVNTFFGIVGGLVVFVAARPLFMHSFKMPESMRIEVLSSLPWLAASVAVSLASGVLSGALEAREKFGYLNSITVMTATSTQLAPLAVAYWHGPNLTWLIPTVLIARMVGVIPNFVEIGRALPLGVGGRFEWNRVKVLFSYGGWITITNLLNPVLTSMDRMLIGSMLNAEAVALYTVPFNLATRGSVLPGAVSTALFPTLSRATREDSARLSSETMAALCAVITPLMVTGIAVFPIFMRLWVGRSFALGAAPVGIVIMIGVWINALAYIPFNQLQATNRPDMPAKLHAFEVVPFLGILWLGLHYFGLIGAAWAWTLRVTFDAMLFFGVAGQLAMLRRVVPGGILVLVAALLSPTMLMSGKTLGEFAVVLVSFTWSWHFDPVIKSILGSIITKLRGIYSQKTQLMRTGSLS